MTRRVTFAAVGMIVVAGARRAEGQNTVNAGAFPPGNYQWRIDVDPGVAGYQMARRVTAAPLGTFTIDIRMANIPGSPPARELRFELYYDPTLIAFVGPPACLPGAAPAPDVCIIDALGPNWVRIHTQQLACGGWSGDVIVARVTFQVVGPTGVSGLDVKDASSSMGNPACGTLIGDSDDNAKAVVVIDPNGLANLSALTVNNTGNAGSCNLALRNPDTDCSDLTLGLAAVTLRSALEVANVVPGANRVTFYVPPVGPLASIVNPLAPQLTDVAGVHVDGTTQPGLGVEARGPVGGATGFDIVSGNNIIEDLTINNFTGAGNAGVRINSGNGNIVRGCRIGTDVNVALAIPNRNGVIVLGGAANQIGVPGNGNWISGNLFDGVVLSGGTGTLVQWNFIGTNAAGNAPLPNTLTGVWINGAANNTIGGNVASTGNLLSGNGWDGVEISGATASGNLVQGNFIGTNAAGNGAVANGLSGVYINGAPNNTVGIEGAAGRNLISGNLQSGVHIRGGASTGNLVKNNYIGPDVTGNLAIPNAMSGVYINGAPGNTIGGATAGGLNVIAGNGVAPAVGHGIGIVMAGSNGNLIQNNRIGLNAAANAPLRNLNDGVRIELGAHDNTVGGVLGNFISANLGDGIRITDAATFGNSIFNASIGVNVGLAGGVAMGNVGHGVQVSAAAHDNHVGGNFDVIGNVICNNAGDGVRLNGAVATEVRGNSIGQNNSGVDQPNLGNGVGLIAGAFDSTIVGNSIYANLLSGVFIDGAGTDQNDVLQNFIGAAAHGNHLDGVHIGGGAQINLVSVNNIGNNGTPGNPLSGNGIHLDGVDTDGNLVTGNQLLGNLGPGVFISDGASLNVVGGDIDLAGNLMDGNLQHGVRVVLGFDNSIRRNIIRFNNLSGVNVASGSGNQISRNSIFANNAVAGTSGLGIDLNDPLGVTPNDPGDGDGGGNNSQNFPVLASAVGGLITGTLNSLPNRTYRIEFFSSPACDASGFGEGQTFVGAIDVATNGQGNAAFASVQPVGPGGVIVTATATDITPDPIGPANDTSEFSACIVHLPGTLCPADTNGDGRVDVDDLIAVILGWGPCPAPPAACPGDVNGSGAVDVDDLIAVILGWGPCP